MDIKPPVPRVLVIGASYGLLVASKIATAGMPVTVVGHPWEVETINKLGVEIEFGPNKVLKPPMGPDGVWLCLPDMVRVSQYDLVFLCVQEPQVGSCEIHNLLSRIGSRLPIAAVMNMPPLPFLSRDSAFQPSKFIHAYRSAPTWSQISERRVTATSPDPQAFRDDPDRPGRLLVTLASNFKFAPFDSQDDQRLLTSITRLASRVTAPWGRVPVNFLTRSSIFTPLTKWPMLITGNCRCVREQGVSPLPISEVVSRDRDQSQILYTSINNALIKVGVPVSILVPFEKYLIASARLSRPSSIALALESGATDVERIDLMVQALLSLHDDNNTAANLVADIVDRIDRRLSLNRINS